MAGDAGQVMPEAKNTTFIHPTYVIQRQKGNEIDSAI
jgi:hypothetical protein